MASDTLTTEIETDAPELSTGAKQVLAAMRDVEPGDLNEPWEFDDLVQALQFRPNALQDALLELEGAGHVIEVCEGDWIVARLCRVCGCDDLHACDGGCTWVEEDLCSACQPGAAQLPARVVDQAEVVPDGEGPELPEGWTQDDEDDLAALETTVACGMKGFMQAGLALREIRDRRLYRASHPTFEAYLAERWEISDSQGYRLIEAADVAADLAQVGVTLARESQARELATLPSPLRLEVGQRLSECPRVTAKVVAEQRAAIEDAHVLRIIETATEPLTKQAISQQLHGLDCYMVLTRLIEAQQIHATYPPGTWDLVYHFGKPAYKDLKVVIPAKLVEEICTAEGYRDTGMVDGFVLRAVRAEIRRMAKSHGTDGDAE